jgi:hypothetical protein
MISIWFMISIWDALDCREETYLVEHGDSSPLQQHIILGDHPHTNNNYMSDDGGRLIETHVVDIHIVVSDGWCSVMSTNDYLSWVPVDEILVKFLGLTKAYETFQLYSSLQIFMIAFPDAFMIDNNIEGYRQWQGTWRVGRLRPPNRSDFSAYYRIGVDHQRPTLEALGMTKSILGHGIEDIS